MVWIFREQVGREPTQEEIANLDITETLRVMVKKRGAVRLERPKRGSLLLAEGSVIVFISKSGYPAHACIAIDGFTVGGYNQAGWYTSEGRSFDYSTHSTADIRWKVTGLVFKDHFASDSRDNDYKLFGVPEQVALGVLRTRRNRIE
jgi:hypothetical protein